MRRIRDRSAPALIGTEATWFSRADRARTGKLSALPAGHHKLPRAGRDAQRVSATRRAGFVANRRFDGHAWPSPPRWIPRRSTIMLSTVCVRSDLVSGAQQSDNTTPLRAGRRIVLSGKSVRTTPIVDRESVRAGRNFVMPHHMPLGTRRGMARSVTLTPAAPCAGSVSSGELLPHRRGRVTRGSADRGTLPATPGIGCGPDSKRRKS